jgi:hypothetical protein
MVSLTEVGCEKSYCIPTTLLGIIQEFLRIDIKNTTTLLEVVVLPLACSLLCLQGTLKDTK